MDKAKPSPSQKGSKKLRFNFGENWSRFLRIVDEPRILQAATSLKEMLGVDSLQDRSFLDVGCGSGLFSLAAVRLKAKRVHSFDYDPQSVACTQELKERFAPKASCWEIEPGDALDLEFLGKLGKWDVVYSWGVLHHTGDLWRALSQVVPLVAKKGILFISIYNDQGWPSRAWMVIKRTYNRLPGIARWPLVGSYFLVLWGLKGVRDLMRGRPGESWRRYGQNRSMSPWHDVVDWVGGWPFEVARPEEIFDFFHSRAFVLERLKTCGSRSGCNEFVFSRR